MYLTNLFPIYPKMKNLLLILVSLLMAGVLFTSCGDDEKEDPKTFGKVILSHASFDAPAVDVYIDDAKAVNNVKLGDKTGYVDVEAGARRLKVTATGQTAEADKKLSFLVLNDNLAAPAAGKAHVRLVHAANAPTVNVVTVDASNAKTGTLLPNFAQYTHTEFIPLDAGTVRVALEAGEAIILPANLTLEAGKIYTVAAIGDPGATPSTLNYQIIQHN
jgi:hypothetical protein